ncbi:uncharacterized protein LOC105186171 isoform X2 [Harpegnathos saltator]|uniref:CHK kinase-like domain-containing protein n=2 Tax=Harpegnathos saltator TaxID=610380 RepID=E2BSS9_HARSA|nr:uncharacterized protein LOC105186171 isoform X2 [Harpegnathos saltator]EFN81252.1 hypothetical protein EAI_03983 [Harpegnathos saltator]
MPTSNNMLPIQDLEVLLKQTYGPDFQINNMKWKPLTDPGENFGSVILAININAQQNDKKRTLNVVVKLPPRSAYLLDLFDSPLTFKKELTFYSAVAPEFLKLQDESGIPREELSVIVPQFVAGRLGLKDPQCFDEQAAIILENLKDQDYTMQDRIVGLDKIHMDFAIGHLAKLHAITIGLKLKKPELFQKTVLPVLNYSSNEDAMNGVIDMVTKTHEDYKKMPEAESYLDRIEKTIKHGFHYSTDSMVETAEEPWGTLVHNDFWVNNMLFKYNESGKPINMKIVDFQLTAYDYGVKDLIFFLISSSQEEVMDDHLDDMIDLYYNSFIDYLKLLNVDIGLFPKSKFIEHLNQSAPKKFNQCIMMVQVIQAARGSVTETSTLNGDKDIFTGGIDDVNYKRKLLHILFTFDRKGWFVN